MAMTNNLKKVLDQPVWEWMQGMPTTINIPENGWTTSQSGKGRYIYLMRSTGFWRLDTYSNVWQTLLSPTYYSPTAVLAMQCQLAQGTRGRVLEAISSTRFRLPYLAGGTALVGEEMRIVYGPGAQEVKTITVAEDATTHDSGIITSGSGTLITDTNKRWKVNQWVGYTCRILTGNNQMEQRNIVYNTENTLYFVDVNLQQYEPWDNQGWRLTPTTNATYEIASQVIEVATPFNVVPTPYSRFMTKTGVIWLISSTTSAPFFTFQMYDILTNTWYQKTMNGQLFSAAIGTEVQIESVSDITGPLVSGTATSGTSRRITDSSKSLQVDRYRNYSIRIVQGTGAGQDKRIIGNKSDYFEVDSKWTINPDATSKYEVYPDDNLLYFIGNGNAATFAYHMEADMWITGPYFDYGVLGNTIVKKDGDVGYGIASGVRATTGVTSIAVAVAGSNYTVGDVLTISTGSATAQCYVTATDTLGAVTAVELRRCGSGYTTGIKATTGGTGTLCTINVLTVNTVATVTTSTNNMLKTGDVVTISGCSEAAWNTSYTILGVWGTTTFDIVITATANLAATSSTSATLLVDANETWDVNEHLGKFVLLVQGGFVTPTTQLRRITSNTANTLTVPAVGAFVPQSGSTRYIILDPASYGRATKFQAKDMYPFGYATGGTTTTIVDTTKNWIRGTWIGMVVRVNAGTGLGAELTITANSNNTLVFAAATFTPDATTRYEIMDTFGTATSGATTSITDTTKNWVTNQWAGKRVRITGGANQGLELAITTNTANTINFSGQTTAMDNTSNYVIMDPPARGSGCGLLWTYGNGNDNYLWTSTGGNTTLWQRMNINNQTYDFGFMITGFLADALTTGSTYAYDGNDTIYVQNSNTGSLYQLNVKKRVAELGSRIPGAMSTAYIGNRMCIVTTEDGLKFLYIGQSNGSFVWRTLLFW
jgi:hypothetical protein